MPPFKSFNEKNKRIFLKGKTKLGIEIYVRHFFMFSLESFLKFIWPTFEPVSGAGNGWKIFQSQQLLTDESNEQRNQFEFPFKTVSPLLQRLLIPFYLTAEDITGVGVF